MLKTGRKWAVFALFLLKIAKYLLKYLGISRKVCTFAAEFNITNRFMDIKSVIYKHGYTVNSLAKAKQIGQSRLNQMVNGNPSAKNLEWLASLIGCHPAEFFADWQGDGLQPQSAEPQPVAEQQEQEQESGDGHLGFVVKPAFPPPAPPKKDNLPFNNEPEQQAEKRDAVAAIICPHCGEAIKLAVI